MNEGKMSRRASLGNMVRRRLSDITNFQPQTKPPSLTENSLPEFASAKDYIDHLVKEKMALAKLIQDKNKFIELSGTEIRHLRACVQKMQLQNWNLAQSNSLMLSEINMGRERMKELNHELACKEALLRTKMLPSREPEVVNEEARNSKDPKCCSATMRRRLSRSRSLSSLKKCNQHAEKETALSKRRCLRRQSGGSRIRHEEQTVHLSEIEEASFPVMPSIAIPSSSTKSIIETEVRARRSSFARPMRKAAEKVQSYKERPINVKMRRPK